MGNNNNDYYIRICFWFPFQLPVRSVFIDGKPSRNYIWRASSIEIDPTHTHPSILNESATDDGEEQPEGCTEDEAEPVDSTHLLEHDDDDPRLPTSHSGSLGRPRNRVKLGTSALISRHDSGLPETSNGEESQEGQSISANVEGRFCAGGGGRSSNRNSQASSSSCVCNNAECTCGAGSHYSTCSSGASTMNCPMFYNSNNNSTMRSCESNMRSMASVPQSVKSRIELPDTFPETEDSTNLRKAKSREELSDSEYSLMSRPLEKVPEGECLGFTSEHSRTPPRPRRRSRSRSPGGRKSRGSKGSLRSRNSLKHSNILSGHDIPRRTPGEGSSATPSINSKRYNPKRDLYLFEVDSAKEVNDNSVPPNYSSHDGVEPYLTDFPATSDPLYAEYGPFQQATSSSDEPISNRSSRVYI